MKVYFNVGRVLAIGAILYVAWLWFNGRIEYKGDASTLNLSELDQTHTIGALAILCITVVGIIRLLARRD